MSVKTINSGRETMVGPLHVAQPLPSHELEYADPFVLLHHAGPQEFEAGKQSHRIAPHPHRGFSPVTLVYQGEVYHRDSLGNHGVVGAKEAQWISSGRGLLHSEGPSESLTTHGGTLELVQLWVNTPRKNKMDEPWYVDITAEVMPKILEHGVELLLVAGSYGQHAGVVSSYSPMQIMMAFFDAESVLQWQAPYQSSLIYVLGGTVEIDGAMVHAKSLATVTEANTIVAQTSARLLLLSGEPLNEPIATGGPFVMNTRVEIFQAFQDAQSGSFGALHE
jgi:quercetin 2,3-dioxygenase